MHYNLTITSLDPTGVRFIVNQDTGSLCLSHLDKINAETIAAIRKHGINLYSISLDKITSLSPEAASELGKFKGDFGFNVYLSGMKTLPVDVARGLSRLSGSLFLDGLTIIPRPVLSELSKSKSRLSLNGLSSLSEGEAGILAMHDGGLSLDGLTGFNDTIAELLALARGELNLNGLISISSSLLGHLSSHTGGYLGLGGIRKLNREFSKMLGRHTDGLCLDGVTSLSMSSAKHLADIRRLSFNSLRSVNVGLANLFANTSSCGADDGGPKKYIYLDGLLTIDSDVAKALVKYNGGLSLNGLTHMSDEVAKIFLDFTGYHLSFRGLKTLNAKYIKIYKGRSDQISIRRNIKPAGPFS